jgi:amino acid transporter
MRGTWQTTGGDGKGWLLLAGVAAGVIAVGSGAAAAAAELLTAIVIGVVVVVVLLVAAGVWWLWREHRRGGLAVVVHQPQALPAPEPRRAVPPVQAPAQITNNFYGYSPADVARAVAEQHAINQER